MAVTIQINKWKKNDGTIGQSWRLIVMDYTVTPRKARGVDPKNYHHYGMDPNDTLEVARVKLKSLQARNKLARLAERRAAIEARLEKNATIQSAYLPPELYERFLEWLKDRRLWDEITPKTQSRLNKMREVIADLNLDPSEWGDKPERIYRWFRTHELGLDYTNKIIALMNLYAYFYCREFKKPCLEIPKPKGDIAVKIETANMEARDGKRAPAKEMDEEDIQKLEDMSKGQRLWMEFSFYFGLRPHEVDSLTAKNHDKAWRLGSAKKAKGKQKERPMTLEVYQPKVVRVPDPRRRWKRIPCILPRQLELVALLAKGVELDRPLVKTIQARLGDGYGTMSGRKSFSKLMRKYGQKKADISRWLGHFNTKTTDRHYDDPDAIDYTPIS